MSSTTDDTTTQEIQVFCHATSNAAGGKPSDGLITIKLDGPRQGRGKATYVRKLAPATEASNGIYTASVRMNLNDPFSVEMTAPASELDKWIMQIQSVFGEGVAKACVTIHKIVLNNDKSEVMPKPTPLTIKRNALLREKLTTLEQQLRLGERTDLDPAEGERAPSEWEAITRVALVPDGEMMHPQATLKTFSSLEALHTYLQTNAFGSKVVLGVTDATQIQISIDPATGHAEHDGIQKRAQRTANRALLNLFFDEIEAGLILAHVNKPNFRKGYQSVDTARLRNQVLGALGAFSRGAVFQMEGEVSIALSELQPEQS